MTKSPVEHETNGFAFGTSHLPVGLGFQFSIKCGHYTLAPSELYMRVSCWPWGENVRGNPDVAFASIAGCCRMLYAAGFNSVIRAPCADYWRSRTMLHGQVRDPDVVSEAGKADVLGWRIALCVCEMKNHHARFERAGVTTSPPCYFPVWKTVPLHLISHGLSLIASSDLTRS